MEWINKDASFLFIGGICSIALPVAIILGKRGYKRSEKRAALKKLEEIGKPEIEGDIESWLNASYEYKIPNVFQLVIQWSLQPLLIIFVSALFTNTGPLLGFSTFIVVILVILHELWLGEEYSNKAAYQFLMLLLWIASYLVVCNSLKLGNTDQTEVKISSPVNPNRPSVAP
ncbi:MULTISPECIES: hypothetical protein [Sphingobacterium]|uniref:hypothetical protein n=1 Tax=Sphingobacterium TaxID=28453 RepID=UPI0028B2388D|nr:hypothetical protein [Sphingobacterium multivorum]